MPEVLHNLTQSREGRRVGLQGSTGDLRVERRGRLSRLCVDGYFLSVPREYERRNSRNHHIPKGREEAYVLKDQ